MPFPPPATDTINWNDIGFSVREVNGHIESHYSLETGQWSEPQFVKDPYLRIHGFAPGLNYGQQCFEGLKAFRDPSDRIRIFRGDQNAARMAHSATFVSLPPVPPAHFLRCVRLAVALNAEFVPPHGAGGAAMYIRPLLFGASAQLGLSPPAAYTFTVYVLPVGVYHGARPVAALVLDAFDRAAPCGTGAAKVGGNYAPVLPWSERARARGFGITLHLDSKTRTEIDEFSTAAFIGVKKHAAGGGDKDEEGYTIVMPDSKNVIKSVTADSCLQLARSFGWKVEVRPIPYAELPSFTEIIAAGTAAALVPVKSIRCESRNDKFVYLGSSSNSSNSHKDDADKNDNDGNEDDDEDVEPGPAFTRLLSTLRGIQLGKLPDSFGWCDVVEEPPRELREAAAGENSSSSSGGAKGTNDNAKEPASGVNGLVS